VILRNMVFSILVALIGAGVVSRELDVTSVTRVHGKRWRNFAMKPDFQRREPN